MTTTSGTGLEIARLVRAFGFSAQGFRAAYRHEPAFRHEVLATPVILLLALWLGDSGLERGVMMGVWLLVPVIELLNSGLEAVVDRIGSEHHELAGRAKDMGSCAVLIGLANAAIVWLLILFG